MRKGAGSATTCASADTISVAKLCHGYRYPIICSHDYPWLHISSAERVPVMVEWHIPALGHEAHVWHIADDVYVSRSQRMKGNGCLPYRDGSWDCKGFWDRRRSEWWCAPTSVHASPIRIVRDLPRRSHNRGCARTGHRHPRCCSRHKLPRTVGVRRMMVPSLPLARLLRRLPTV